jgi:hypothetical protein
MKPEKLPFDTRPDVISYRVELAITFVNLTVNQNVLP